MSSPDARRFTTRPELHGTFGMVASTHWIASAVGMSLLEAGGNAFDAAVATAFALQVVEPHLNGPGGDAPILLFDIRRGVAEVVCGQGPAPAAATVAHFRHLGLDLVPGTGLLAPCIPGSVDAFLLLLRDYGTKRLRDVLAPAISYARSGYPLLDRAAATIATVREHFLGHWPTSAALWLDGSDVPTAGTMMRNPQLAATYERLLEEGAGAGSRDGEIECARAAWSSGFVAECIDRFCRHPVMDVSGRPHAGLLTGADMAGWSASVETPVGFRYGRTEVLKPGPWSQGLVMLQQLALLDGLSLDGRDPTDPEAIHWQVEAAKLCFADRDRFYGDPLFASVPIETLLSKSYNAERRALISSKASFADRPGHIAGFGTVAATLGHKPAADAREGAGEPTVGTAEARGDTVHFSIVDRWGNMVSATPSGGWLHSSPTIPELGFCLGTRAQMFVLDEGHPACLAPGKRPRSTLSPTLALRDGEPWLAWGTPGGDQQDQWIPQVFLRHIHAGLNLQEAIDAPAWHSEHPRSSFWPRTSRPGVLVVEERMPARTIRALRRRGHTVEVGGPWSEGRVVAVARDGGWLKAAANPRGMQGYAVGR